MKKLWFTILACFFLNSCGKNVTVNLAETALLWRIDDYFDINQKQRKEIKSHFRQAMKEVNDEYVPGLSKVIFADDLLTKDCAAVQKGYQELKPQVDEMRTRFLKHAHPFIDSVSSKQIDYFIEKASEDIEKDEKKSKSDQVASLEKRLDRTRNTLEELFGKLSSNQEQAIRAHILERKNFEALMVESRRKNVALLQLKTEPEAKTFLKDYVVQWRDFHTPELRAAMVEREAYNEKFFTTFFCRASVEQKKHFQKTVSEYLDLIRKVYIEKS